MQETDEQFMQRMMHETGINVADIMRGQEILNKQALDRIYNTLTPKKPERSDR